MPPGRIYDSPPPGISEAAAQIDSAMAGLRRSWQATLTGRPRETFRDRFTRLSNEWQTETEYESSVTRIAMHPAYQRIIGMGPEAIPLILEDLRETHAPWFWALTAITGENPVPEEDRGYIYKMEQAWTRWGNQRGYL